MATIALIDYDQNILTSISIMLEDEGHNIQTNNNGQSVYDAFTKSLPDLSVLDIKLPFTNGMDLPQRMRHKTSIPAICLTSKDDKIEKILGLRMGADDCVKKTFSQRFLFEHIKSLLRRKEAQYVNICPMLADAASEPLEARLVVGIPV